MELSSLSWPELMTAGGLAGVTAWIVGFAGAQELIAGDVPLRRDQDSHAKHAMG